MQYFNSAQYEPYPTPDSEPVPYFASWQSDQWQYLAPSNGIHYASENMDHYTSSSSQFHPSLTSQHPSSAAEAAAVAATGLTGPNAHYTGASTDAVSAYSFQHASYPHSMQSAPQYLPTDFDYRPVMSINDSENSMLRLSKFGYARDSINGSSKRSSHHHRSRIETDIRTSLKLKEQSPAAEMTDPLSVESGAPSPSVELSTSSSDGRATVSHASADGKSVSYQGSRIPKFLPATDYVNPIFISRDGLPISPESEAQSDDSEPSKIWDKKGKLASGLGQGSSNLGGTTLGTDLDSYAHFAESQHAHQFSEGSCSTYSPEGYKTCLPAWRREGARKAYSLREERLMKILKSEGMTWDAVAEAMGLNRSGKAVQVKKSMTRSRNGASTSSSEAEFEHTTRVWDAKLDRAVAQLVDEHLRPTFEQVAQRMDEKLSRMGIAGQKFSAIECLMRYRELELEEERRVALATEAIRRRPRTKRGRPPAVSSSMKGHRRSKLSS